ncbi:MAG: hypothetical protein QXX71_00270 [Candidatus Nanoarchaeia archaeon]|nr:hypothetical protein [Candidatus Haiyanarchaeum thermophilum]MCW1303123.1 hypothetical protein [Candidatus Haiyanarchaeum thermophilum]MCW1303788.1 hypothetical protein [Candidatus Haiyanarchaeum thermophilum]MCW1306597.1 hypothetical protein [Candidatus Haiyanarchaeum thermophilum]MCW1307009.1 hypothetical protein [Candidatus Haiyanarchaeum thermophilum]
MEELFIVALALISASLNIVVYQYLLGRDRVLMEIRRELNTMQKKILEGSVELSELNNKMIALSKEFTKRLVGKSILASFPSILIVIIGLSFFNLAKHVFLFVLISLLFSILLKVVLRRTKFIKDFGF